jgi:hypothetical protein
VLLNNRVLWKSGSIQDLSVGLSDYLSGSNGFAIASTHTLYIGADMPFNHRWLEVSSPNSAASVVSVSLWDGMQWQPAVDVIDQTALSGHTLAQSGVISWAPNRLKNWTLALSTEYIPELSSVSIYNMYWAKLTFSGSLSAGTSLKYMGHKFSSDMDLFSEYPIFSNTAMINAFAAGKSDWTDQTFLAAEYLIQDLRISRVAWSPNQILEWMQFRPASVHKIAEIIFRAFGKDYTDEATQANRAYKDSFQVKQFLIDKNVNAQVDEVEEKSSVEFMDR